RQADLGVSLRVTPSFPGEGSRPLPPPSKARRGPPYPDPLETSFTPRRFGPDVVATGFLWAWFANLGGPSSVFLEEVLGHGLGLRGRRGCLELGLGRIDIVRDLILVDVVSTGLPLFCPPAARPSDERRDLLGRARPWRLGLPARAGEGARRERLDHRRVHQ